MVYTAGSGKDRMNSIDQQQPEQSRNNLSGKEAIDKIRELTDKAKTCFFCTNIRSNEPFETRPMAVLQVDDQGDLWFLSADDSHKNQELGADNFVQLLCQGSPHSDFLSIYGKATVSRDPKKIDELWTAFAGNWFTGGKDDARITVIQVEMISGYYWDTKHGTAVAFAKQLIGAVTGKTLDDSEHGKLSA